jgi:hypothetical protein
MSSLKIKSLEQGGSEKHCFFNDVLCVPVNPTHRVLPSMPASIPADTVVHASMASNARRLSAFKLHTA